MKRFLLSVLKYLTLPLAVLYGLVVFIRNLLYDLGIFDSIGFSFPVICVGNITVGGTGKSPHIEYLIELLSPRYAVATLSRGYRRHSRGFRLAEAGTDAREIGDEPFQFKAKHPHIEVCVAEERMTAIPQLLQRRPHLQAILLDDAFQHRTVKAGLNILLTDYGRLYTRDFIMPFGLLRESRSASARAGIIVVTKCPAALSEEEALSIRQEIKPKEHQQVFFSTIDYKPLYALTPQAMPPGPETTVLMMTGIANPAPLKEHLSRFFRNVHELSYPDHHYFTTDDLNEIQEAFAHLPGTDKIIVTTEKDAARLMLWKDRLLELQIPIFAQSIGTRFLFGQEEEFQQRITDFMATFFPPDEEHVPAVQPETPAS